MLDQRVRALLDPVLSGLARPLHRAGVTPTALTATGFVVGMAAAVAAGLAAWWAALALWLLGRALDGLDGAVARHGEATSDLGGYVDVVADFAVYGAFVVGCAVGAPWARVPLLVLLATYYVNGTAFLAFTAMVERRQHATGLEDERSLVFSRGLAEGTETVVAHALFVLFPAAMAGLAWAFAAVVGVTIVQRVADARRVLVG